MRAKVQFKQWAAGPIGIQALTLTYKCKGVENFKFLQSRTKVGPGVEDSGDSGGSMFK